MDKVDLPTNDALWCAEWELSAESGLHGVSPRSSDQNRTRVLVRIHGEPLGYVLIERSASDFLDEMDSVRDAVDEQLLDQLNAHLAAEGVGVVSTVKDLGPLDSANDRCPNRVDPLGLISVIVCTRDRSDILGDCLERLQALTYADLEFVVVDNAPSDDGTRALVDKLAHEDKRFVYVCEPIPGLSNARNRGLGTARSEIVAFTDDDVSVDPGWIEGLVRGFRRRLDVACVTGLVCTANITNSYEAYFDARTASWSSRCVSEIFDMQGSSRRDPLYPYSAGIFGTGANFAIRRDVMLASGGFDAALGAGTKARGGEDLDMFIRVLRAERAIAYEPSAVVWHHHRADERALLKQMYGYGTGLSAYLTKLALGRETRRDLIRRIPRGIRKLLMMNKETEQRLLTQLPAPAGVLKQERLGFLAGPYLYLRARRESVMQDAATSRRQG